MGPLKDLDYTLCFYKSGNDENAYKMCSKTNRFSLTFLSAAIPFIFRLCFVIKNRKDKKTGRYGKLVLLNMFKLTCSILVVMFQYLYTHSITYNPSWTNTYLLLWSVLSVITFLLMYFWDVYMDWGLLRLDNSAKNNIHGRLLRKELSYNNPSFYYLAMIVNLILRGLFIITISPNLLNIII